MSAKAPAPDCLELLFRTPRLLDENAEVALEDYARALARARTAEGLRREDDPRQIQGVHVCGARAEATAALRKDLEDFAGSLIPPAGDGRLGWS